MASWRASGKTAEEYSAGRGWSAGTLLWWSSKLGREAPRAVRMAQLVRSPVPRNRGEQPGVIVVEVLDARVRVTVDPGAGRDAVVTILGLLASRVERRGDPTGRQKISTPRGKAIDIAIQSG